MYLRLEVNQIHLLRTPQRWRTPPQPHSFLLSRKCSQCANRDDHDSVRNPVCRHSSRPSATSPPTCLGALDFGMVVDGSVVMVENIRANYSRPKPLRFDVMVKISGVADLGTFQVR